MPIAVPNPDEWFELEHGIPHPNWTLFENWIMTEAEAEAFDEAWDVVAENWLTRVGRALGPEYRVGKSPHFLLLTPHSAREQAPQLEAAEQAHTRVTKLLGDLCRFHHGRVVALRFVDADHYYRYIAHGDDDEAELPMTGGVFINRGLPHVVCHSRMFEEFCDTLSHELAHFYTAHLSLPAWVGEGIAMLLEPRQSHLPSSERIAKHRAHWTPETIQDFWSGASWSDPSEVFNLSYELAAVIFDVVRTELKPPPEAFRAFVRDARREDGGAEAARMHLRTELSELVEQFLGPGDWEPRPWF
jgi:hypothetical protein